MKNADWLLTNRQAYDHQKQRELWRTANLAYTGDAAVALKLVPEEPVRVTQSVREAGHIAADLIAGIAVEPMTGENHMEIIETLLRILAERVKQYGDLLGNLGNHIKAFQQRLQQAMQAQAKKNGQAQQAAPDPKDAAKAQAMIMQQQTKDQLATKSHAVRTAQKQVQFDMKLRQQMEQHQADLAKTDLEAASAIRRNRLKATEE